MLRPTRPVKMPRSAVRVVRRVRKFTNSNILNALMRDWQSAFLNLLSRDFMFLLVLALAALLISVDFFDLRKGPLHAVFARHLDTFVGAWLAANLFKFNGLITLLPVALRFNPSSRVVSAVCISVAVIVLQPADELTYLLAAVVLLLVLELHHAANVLLMLMGLLLIIITNILSKPLSVMQSQRTSSSEALHKGYGQNVERIIKETPQSEYQHSGESTELPTFFKSYEM